MYFIYLYFKRVKIFLNNFIRKYFVELYIFRAKQKLKILTKVDLFYISTIFNDKQYNNIIVGIDSLIELF